MRFSSNSMCKLLAIFVTTVQGDHKVIGLGYFRMLFSGKSTANATENKKPFCARRTRSVPVTASATLQSNRHETEPKNNPKIADSC